MGHPERRRFITTEPIADSNQSQQMVWERIQQAFSERACLGYWRYPLFAQVGQGSQEPDIVVADRELGVMVLEVVSVTIDQILAVQEDTWQFQATDQPVGSPWERVQRQLQALLGQCDRQPSLFRQVTGRALLALPLITQEAWQQQGFPPLPILFQADLNSDTILPAIQQLTPAVAGTELDTAQADRLFGVLGGTSVLRRAPRNRVSAEGMATRGDVIATMHEQLHSLDLQQAHIGTEIPPGMQRIRGIAGSGKTVLLCQKAAHMYLKHPDWNIAFVFFSRSLYDPIEKLLDQWIRHFSHGEAMYDFQARQKLRVLHAWGAYNQPGFYSTIAELHGQERGAVVKDMTASEGLAQHCKTLLDRLEQIEPFFDAVLIDEGQDLVVDRNDLKYQDKQAIYWLAYQSLKPCDPDHPEQRRLIWAYDEAQSLDNLVIPDTQSLFGAGFQNLMRGQHKGGIKKSEIMYRCYRTPGPILTAAHAIGMGLLRPEGMLSGITQKEGWEKIGYEVIGRFTSGQLITLHRPPENSPNPIPQLWDQPVLEFEVYGDRPTELAALAERIHHNLQQDGLKPSREILVIVLGAPRDAKLLEAEVAQFLIQQGIDIYIPGAPGLNRLEYRWQESQPNCFWQEGGVTVSRIHRAKGNEAEMVYVVGADRVAKEESQVNLRNQLFVAMTRSRGWLALSGIGNYPMYQEIRNVIDSGDRFSFVFRRQPKRMIREADDTESVS